MMTSTCKKLDFRGTYVRSKINQTILCLTLYTYIILHQADRLYNNIVLGALRRGSKVILTYTRLSTNLKEVHGKYQELPMKMR